MLEIVLKVDNKQFKRFESVDINLMLDSIASTYSFTGLFDVDNKLLKKLFTPLSYLKAEVWAIDEEKNIKRGRYEQRKRFSGGDRHAIWTPA